MQEISKIFNSPVVSKTIFFSGTIFLTRLVTRFTLPQAVTEAMVLQGVYEITRNKTIDYPIAHSMLSIGLSVAILSAVYFSTAIYFPHAAPWAGSMISQYRGATALKFFPLMVLFQSIYALTLDKKGGVDEVTRDLIKAYRISSVPLVKFLLANIEAVDQKGITPLLWACRESYPEIVELLLAKGANIEAVDQNGNTPLIWACKKGYSEIVELLLAKGANIEAIDRGENTPLSSAKSLGHTKIVELLLAKGATE